MRTISNPRYSNEAGGIVVDWTEDGQSGEAYLEPGSEDHAAAEAGTWGAVQTAFTPRNAVQEERAGMRLTLTQFAIIASRAPYSWLTKAEAKAFLQRNALPAWVTAALAAEDDPEEAEMRIWGASTISRLDPLLSVVQAARGATDEDLDQAFRDGAAL